MSSKYMIENALKRAGMPVRKAKKFVARLPRRWFDQAGNVIPGAIEADADHIEHNDYIERLLSRKI